VLLASVGTALVLGTRSEASWPATVEAGWVLVAFYGTYASLAILALLVYSVGDVELRALATVSILGPFTLLRPAVILAGAACAMLLVPHLEVYVGATYAGLAGVLAEPILERWRKARPLP